MRFDWLCGMCVKRLLELLCTRYVSLLEGILTYFDSIPIPIEQAAENIGKMGISAAMAMGNIVKTKIEEEIHKHQQGEGGDDDERGASGTSSDGADAVGGEDIQEEEEGGEDGTADESRILISKVSSH